MKKALYWICTLALLSGLAGCGVGELSASPTSDKAPPPSSTASDPDPSQTEQGAEEKTYLWLITIEEKTEGQLFGVYGDDSVPCEYTAEIYATNDNSVSPYEGTFTVAGKIHAFWDFKEDYNLPDVDFLEFESDHVIQPCTFQLVRNDLAPLTQNPDSLLQGSAAAEFLMPTKGDNPANFSGAAQGFGFGENRQLDMAATCTLIQTNAGIELKTDVFGIFHGKIERLEAGFIPNDVDLAPLVPKE